MLTGTTSALQNVTITNSGNSNVSISQITVSGASYTITGGGTPATVTLSGTGVVQHTVSLSWTASTSTVSGYSVYRSTTSGSGYVKINSSLVSGLTYTDSTVASGTTYYYVTTALDSSGNESAYSHQATAVIP